jgi:hypothetical protein
VADAVLLLFVALGRGELQLMPREAADLLARAESIELLSLDPEMETAKATSVFRGFAVLGSTAVRDREAQAGLVKAVGKAVVLRPWNSIGVCFRPRHGLRVKSGETLLEVAICFECSRMEVDVNGKQQAVRSIGGSAQGHLDELLKAAKVPLAAKPRKDK